MKKSPGLPLLIFSFIILTKTLLISLAMNTPFSLTLLFSSLAFVLVLSSFTLLVPTSSRHYAVVLLDFFISFFLLADLLYYRYFNMPVSLYLFFETSNIQDLGPSIKHISSWYDFLIFADLPLLPFLYKLNFPQLKIWRKALPGLLLTGLFLFSLTAFFSLSDGSKIFHRSNSLRALQTLGPLNYHLVDAFNFLRDLHVSLTESQIAEIENWFAQKNSQPYKRHPSYDARFKNHNLIIIQVESLQSFVIGESIAGQEITPRLNELLKNSIYFPHMYPQTLEGNSSDAELLMNTSIYPLQRGSAFCCYPHTRYPSLPYLLKNKGYTSSVFHGDAASYWKRDLAFPSLGFDHYYDISKFEQDELLNMGLSDSSFFRQSSIILRKTATPFYAFLITLTSHHPFTLPAKYNSLVLPPEMDATYPGNYLQSIHYTDQALGLFLDKLNEAKLLEDSVIVIYGDHDGLFESDKPLLEETWFKRKIGREEWLRRFVPVPFIIFNPSLNEDRQETICGQVDMLPTVSSLLGIGEEAARFSMGQNLFTCQKGFAIVPQGDYLNQDLYIGVDSIRPLEQAESETLDIADLLIRGNFFSLTGKVLNEDLRLP